MKDNNSIVNRIIDDARSKADVIIGEARVRAAEIVARAEQDAKATSVTFNGQLRIRTAEILERKASVDRLDGKRLLADSRYALMDKTYRTAADKIAAMPQSEYIALVKSILMAASEDGDIVHIRERDSKIIGQSLVQAVADKRAIKLTLSDKYVDIDGGVYLEGSRYDKSYSISTMIERVRNELDTQVAKILLEVK